MAKRIVKSLTLKQDECIVIGAHSESQNLTGYFANIEPFNRDKRKVCEREHTSWHECGHGKTPEDAIKDLRRVRNGGKAKFISSFVRRG